MKKVLLVIGILIIAAAIIVAVLHYRGVIQAGAWYMLFPAASVVVFYLWNNWDGDKK